MTNTKPQYIHRHSEEYIKGYVKGKQQGKQEERERISKVISDFIHKNCRTNEDWKKDWNCGQMAVLNELLEDDKRDRLKSQIKSENEVD